MNQNPNRTLTFLSHSPCSFLPQTRKQSFSFCPLSSTFSRRRACRAKSQPITTACANQGPSKSDKDEANDSSEDDEYFEKVDINSSSNDNEATKKKKGGKNDNDNSYITVEQGMELQKHALSLLNEDVHRLADYYSRGVVEALYECYTSEEFISVFVVVGPGFNGLVGLHIALQLRRLGYEPYIYTSINGNKYVRDIPKFLKSHPDSDLHKEIQLFDFIPSTFSFYFDVVVDALFGLSFDGGDVHPEYWPVYETLITTDVPIVSVDMPSGWDLSIGPRAIDLTADTFIKPDLLVSLGAAKLGSKRFQGNFHFIASTDDLMSQDWFKERNIETPKPSNGDVKVDSEVNNGLEMKKYSLLFQSNANAFGKLNGEMYDRPGQFNATLFTKNKRRKYVDPEDEDSDDFLWLELD